VLGTQEVDLLVGRAGGQEGGALGVARMYSSLHGVWRQAAAVQHACHIWARLHGMPQQGCASPHRLSPAAAPLAPWGRPSASPLRHGGSGRAVGRSESEFVHLPPQPCGSATPLDTLNKRSANLFQTRMQQTDYSSRHSTAWRPHQWRWRGTRTARSGPPAGSSRHPPAAGPGWPA